VKTVEKKKEQITDSNARMYFVMTLFTAVLLFFYMEVSGRTAQAPAATRAPSAGQKEWQLLRQPAPRHGAARPRNVRAMPAYPWDETQSGLKSDLQAARRIMLGKPLLERDPGKEARRLLDSRIVLPSGSVLLWQLRKNIEKQLNIGVFTDADAWNRHPWITSSGKEEKLEEVLLQLEKRSGVKHVLMKNHAGDVSLFLMGPQTSD
jgi:hypothetical protein